MLPPVERLRLMPPDEVTRVLLGEPEGQWYDRKSARIKARELANPLVALANADGGVLVIGLSGGECEGVDSKERVQNDWRRAGVQFTVPPVPYEASLLDCVNRAGDADHVFVIEVPPGDRVHANRKDEVFARVGDSNHKLTFDERLLLEYERGEIAFELRPVPAESEIELDEAALASYAEQIGHPDPGRVLNAMPLVGGDGQLLTAGALLFGVNPQRAFPQALVRTLRYEGKEARTGEEQNLRADRYCQGPLPRQIDEAAGFIREQLPKWRQLGADGRFDWFPIVPDAAWMEALVNAVLHRAYSDFGDHVRVQIFDDRIEVSSPGRFASGPPPRDLANVRRAARNPRIARVMGQLRYGQDVGEGLRRMAEVMESNRRPPPEIRQTAGGVKITLRAPAPELRRLAELPAATQRVYEHLKRAGRLGTAEAAALEGVSRPTALRHLTRLAEAELARRVGGSRNDPRAYWTLGD